MQDKAAGLRVPLARKGGIEMTLAFLAFFAFVWFFVICVMLFWEDGDL